MKYMSDKKIFDLLNELDDPKVKEAINDLIGKYKKSKRETVYWQKRFYDGDSGEYD
jgi:hypothetical protein